MAQHVMHSIGVSGVVMNEQGQVLLVRQRYGGAEGRWVIPGGYVHEGEPLTQTVIREVKEEADVDAEVIGIVGIRHRTDTNNLLVIFLLRHVSGTPTPDGREVSEARWFSRAEIERANDITGLSKVIALRAFDGMRGKPLSELHVPDRSGTDWMLFGW